MFGGMGYDGRKQVSRQSGEGFGVAELGQEVGNGECYELGRMSLLKCDRNGLFKMEEAQKVTTSVRVCTGECQL